MSQTIQLRGDLSANWTSVNPVLNQREVGVETDTGKAKLGDGVTHWASLAYWKPAGDASDVMSVFGRTGVVAATSGDYSVGQVTGAAPLASPALTGAPTAPTQAASDSSTKIATTAFVSRALPVTLAPSGDSSGAADSAAIGAATGHVILAPGAWYIGAPGLTSSQTWLQGNGPATIVNVVTGGTGFTVVGPGQLYVSDMAIAVGSGAYAFTVNGAYDAHFWNLYLSGATAAGGVKINGDDALEQHWTDVVMKNLGGIAFDYERTTSIYTGSLYLDRVRIVTPPAGAKGFKFNSTAGSPSLNTVFMTECVADSYEEDAYEANNVAQVFATDCWFAVNSSAAGGSVPMRITGGLQHNYNGCYTYNGLTSGADVIIAGSPSGVFIGGGHVFDGAGGNTALSLSGATLGAGSLVLGPYLNYCGTLTDTPTGLSYGGQAASPPVFYTDGSGASSQVIGVIDTANPSGNTKWIRNGAGALQILNNAFNKVLLALADNGALTLGGNVTIQANDAALNLISTLAAQFNGPAAALYNAISSLGSQGGVQLQVGINNTGITQAYATLTQVDYTGAYVRNLITIDLNAQTIQALLPLVAVGGFSADNNRLTALAAGAASTDAATVGQVPFLTGTTVQVPAPTGVTATDTPAVTAAIAAWVTALASGPATLQFGDGTYQMDSNQLVIRSVANFAVKGTGATVIAQAPNRTGLPNNTAGDMMVIADCSDFTVSGITFDGLRDTLAPLSPLTATAASGQPSVTIASGQGARYTVGQVISVCGGLGTSDAALYDANHVISSITPGGGSGGGDLITFTGNLVHSFTQISSTLVSDPFGPYACDGAYLSPYQTGSATVAGRALSGQDQQNGLHLIACTRFAVTGIEARSVWESPVRLGTYATSLTDGCTSGTVSGCRLYHGYDQGVAVWISQNITVANNVINSAGWAGVSCTASDYCTVSGNQILNSAYQHPLTTNAGSGVVTEGGQGNQFTGNIISNSYAVGIQFSVSPLGWGLTTSTSPTTSTYLTAGTAAGTSIQVSSTTHLQAGGLYSIVDGSRTEAVSVNSIVDGTHVKFNEVLQFSHASGLPLTFRVPAGNVAEGNTVNGTVSGAGIWAALGVRNVIKNNTVLNTGNGSGQFGPGILLSASSLELPSGIYLAAQGSVIGGNVAGGCSGQAILADEGSNLTVTGNRCYGGTGNFPVIDFKGITDSVLSGNYVSDNELNAGIKIEIGTVTPDQASARLTVTGNIVRRTHGEGIIALSADSLTITGNTVSSCGGNAGINLRGVTNSAVAGNVCNSNNNAGIQLEDNSSAHCLSNRVTGNTTRDDATGSNVATGATWTQQHGIVEAGNSNNNLFTGNESDSNAVDQLTIVGAASYAWGNILAGSPSGSLPLALGGTGSATRSFAGLLTPTAVKTGAYGAAAGDFVPCDTTSGSFTVTLPSAPADLTVVGIKQVIQASTNTVTIACAGSDVFNKAGGATSATLTLLAQGLILQYKASGAIWYVLADDLPLPQLDTRYVAQSTLTALGDLLYENATPAPARLAGNTSATKNFLTQTGNGSVSAAPVWGAIAAGDLPAATTSTQGAVIIDGTAGDIQPLGTSASAGNKGQAADAKHAHAWGQAAPANFKPSNPAQTVSTTLVMAGIGSTCSYTPAGSGLVVIMVTGQYQTNTGLATVTIGGRYGTGTAPANGVAVTGTRFGGAADGTIRGGGTGILADFAMTDLLTLTPGTAYWLDLAFDTGTAADPALLTNISMTVFELP